MKKGNLIHTLKIKESKQQNTYRLSGLMTPVINFSVPAALIGILIGVSFKHWFLAIRKTTNTNHMQLAYYGFKISVNNAYTTYSLTQKYCDRLASGVKALII